MAEDWYTGMDTEFARRLKAMIEASGGRISVGSGYRSVEEQQILWDNSAQDGVWVAKPGSSNHNWGVAADLGFDGDAQQWAHDNAGRFGLIFPMDWEPWHIEPVGVRDGTYKSDAAALPGEGNPGTQDAYTTTPPGSVSPVDATQRFDLGYQLNMLNGILLAPNPGEVNNPNANIQMAAEPTQVGGR